MAGMKWAFGPEDPPSVPTLPRPARGRLIPQLEPLSPMGEPQSASHAGGPKLRELRENARLNPLPEAFQQASRVRSDAMTFGLRAHL